MSARWKALIVPVSLFALFSVSYFFRPDVGSPPFGRAYRLLGLPFVILSYFPWDAVRRCQNHFSTFFCRSGDDYRDCGTVQSIALYFVFSALYSLLLWGVLQLVVFAGRARTRTGRSE